MYECIKGFLVEVCDDNGFTIENEYFEVEKGTIWNIPEDEDYRLIGGEVRLENPFDGWLEISKEHFKKYFRKVNTYK